MENHVKYGLRREGEHMKSEWRMFKPLKEDLSELEDVKRRKGLSRRDIQVVLTSLELSENGKKAIAEGKGY